MKWERRLWQVMTILVAILAVAFAYMHASAMEKLKQEREHVKYLREGVVLKKHLRYQCHHQVTEDDTVNAKSLIPPVVGDRLEHTCANGAVIRVFRSTIKRVAVFCVANKASRRYSVQDAPKAILYAIEHSRYRGTRRSDVFPLTGPALPRTEQGRARSPWLENHPGAKVLDENHINAYEYQRHYGNRRRDDEATANGDLITPSHAAQAVY